MHSEKPVVLISGCSSGIGMALAREFAARGCQVVATARKIESIASLAAENIALERLDVTDASSVGGCAARTQDRFGRIDILVNNAGHLLVGPIVELNPGDLARQIDTNITGLIALTRAVAPGMIQRRSGTIVNMSSVSGVLATPFAGAYCATKAAVNALSDSLRVELAPFGIRVVLVQPGRIISHLGASASVNLDRYRETPYGPVREFIVMRAHASQDGAMPAEDFAQRLVPALMRKRPPALVRLGPDSRRLPFIAGLPRRFVDRLLTGKFGLDRLS